VFVIVQEEYKREGLQWETIKCMDNSAALELLEGRLGIIDLLNEESMRGQGNDLNFLAKMKSLCGQHSCYVSADVKMQKDTFAIKHYAGKVTYCVSGFVDRNNDTLSEEIRGLVQTSTNQLLKGIFSVDDLAATSKDAADSKAAAAAELQAGKSPSKLQSFLKQASVTQKFKTQLGDLMGVIEGTTVQYVRCIKPNARKSPEIFDRKMVVEQLRCAGMIDAVKISRSAYPYRVTHAGWSGARIGSVARTPSPFNGFRPLVSPLCMQSSPRVSRVCAARCGCGARARTRLWPSARRYWRTWCAWTARPTSRPCTRSSPPPRSPADASPPPAAAATATGGVGRGRTTRWRGCVRRWRTAPTRWARPRYAATSPRPPTSPVNARPLTLPLYCPRWTTPRGPGVLLCGPAGDVRGPARTGAPCPSAPHRTVLHCTALYCIALHHTAPHCTTHLVPLPLVSTTPLTRSSHPTRACPLQRIFKHILAIQRVYRGHRGREVYRALLHEQMKKNEKGCFQTPSCKVM